MSEENLIVACPNCNEPMEAGWTRCPACLTPTSSSGLTCPSCHAPVNSTWKECPRCQTPLSGRDTPSGSAVHPPESSQYSDKDKIYFSQDQKEAPGVVGIDFDLPLGEGEILGDRYRVIKKLGRGGFGAVYQVHDMTLKEEFALKIVVTGEGRAERATEQLIHEFSLREKIDNTAHIVKAYDPRPCEYKGLSLVLLPMELADGGSLRHWLVQNRDSKQRREAGIEFFKQACSGVAAIHGAGLVHLDIKPENILLVGGKAKIADFGIGRFGASHFGENPDQLLRQGIGTPQYMSPEQFHVARQKDVGPASDVYSLGVVLFEILDGSLPFDGTVMELREKHLKMEPPELKGDLEKWSRIVQHCLAKKPENRYKDIEHLITDIDRAIQGVSLSVDVSCPRCGHINADISHDICDKCGVHLPDTLFHECRRCLKKLRLDTEICPGCGFHIMAYYVLEDRWARLHTLKDEDPVGALELLEVVLRDGAGEHEDNALELVRNLRKKQSEIRDLIAEADKATANGELEKALDAWYAVLEVVPRHRVALEQIEKLEALVKGFGKDLSEAESLMDHAQFEDADARLQACLELVPQREEIRNMLETCRQRAHEYAVTFARAAECSKQRLLLQANQYVKVALAQAEKSSEARALADRIASTLEKTRGLTEQIHYQLSRAEFGRVRESIAEVRQLQSDNTRVSEFETQLNRTQDAYMASMRHAQLATEDRDLDKASAATEKALKLCPESLEAKSLLKQLSKDRSEALDLLEKARSLMLAAHFSDAKILLEQVQQLWPTAEGLEEATGLLARTRLEYEKHVQRSHHAKTNKALDEALAEAELACGVCPQSAEAKTLLEAIQESQSRVCTLLKEAAASTRAARFDEANTRLLEVEDIGTDVSGLAGAREELVRAREPYSRAMKAAREAQAQRDLAEALHATEMATSVCPKSKEAIALTKSIKKDQSAAKNHLKEAADACKAGEFEKTLNRINQAEQIWPKVPGLDEAKMHLLEAEKARRRVKMQWGIVAAVALVLIYLTTKLVFILVNRQYANAAIGYAKKGDYVNAIREYHRCYTIPLLVSSPQLPEDARRRMDAANITRKEQLASAVNQAEGLFSKGQIEEAESVANKVCELVVTDEENRKFGPLREKISNAAAQRKHDALVAQAQVEILLAKKIKLLEKALSFKQTPSARQLLQAAVAEQRRRPKIGDTITNSIDMKLVYIPQGEFIMGRSEEEEESPQHRVTISRGFYMGACEVTQSQYKAIMGSNPSGHKKLLRGGGLPVERVSWNDATEFCRELGRRERRTYRLPTEAEWEFACRAGSATRFSFGNGLALSEYAWYERNSGGETHPVGKKQPNAFGLYDIHGNVHEWCNDWYARYTSAGDQIDPQGPPTGSARVLRGGDCGDLSADCRSAARHCSEPDDRTYASGFRVVLDLR